MWVKKNWIPIFRSTEAQYIRCLLLLFFLLFNILNISFGQVNGDYQTFTNPVNWSTPGNWQKRIGGSWVVSPDYPGQFSGAGNVTILSGTTVNMDVNPANSIGGFTFQNGTTSTLNITTHTLNISGILTYGVPNANKNDIVNISSGTLNCSSVSMQNSTGTNQLNITTTGTVTVSGSIITQAVVVDVITFSASGTMNVGGNFVGPVTFNCGTSTVNFNGNAGSQSIGSFTYYILNCLNLASRTTSGLVTVNNNSTISGGSLTIGANIAVAGTMLVNGAILDCQTFSITGGIFTLANNNSSTLISGNLAGIMSAGATGSIQTTTRNYNTGANYTFDGASLQATGTGLPANVNNLKINNSNNATLTQSVQVNNAMILTSGSIDIGNNDLVIGVNSSITGTFSSASMIITSGSGSLKKSGNNSTDFIMTYPVGSGGNYNPMVITSLAATVIPSATIAVHSYPIQRMPSSSSLNKYWNVTSSNLSNINANINFTYNSTEIVGTESNYITKRFDGTAFQSPEGALINTTTKTISATGATILTGDWTAIDPDGISTAIDGPENVFQNRTQVYTITPGNSNYSWTVTGGTITYGQGTNSIIVTWNNTVGTGNIIVNYVQNGFNVAIPQLSVTRYSFPFSCFSYYRKIDIKGSMVSSGSVTNFPMMVNITDPTLKSVENGGHIANNAGYDIYFASDAAGTQPLEYQLDDYDPSTGQLVAWVKMTSLNTTNSSIYIFYGNYSITFDASTSDVWGSDYVGVFHMGQELKDYSLGCNDGENTGTSIVNGKIGKGRLFNRNEKDYIQITNEPVFNFGNQMTVSFWINLNTYPTAAGAANDWIDYVSKGDNKNFRFVGNRLASSPNCKNMFFCFGAANTDITSACNSIPANSSWIHIAGTYDGSLPLRNLFVNGVKVIQNSSLLSSIPLYACDKSPVLIGINSQAQDTRAFDGIMDELHISNKFKADNWILTEYNNQSNLTNVALSGTGEQTLPISSAASVGTVTATPNTLFAREYSTLTLSSYTGTSIQWQSSLDNINFTDITNKISSPQQTDPLLNTSYFRVMVNNGGCSVASTSKLITVTPPFISCSIGKRKKITINDASYAGSDDLTNFPFLLQINNDNDLKHTSFGGKVQSLTGWDIRFTSSDGLTLLPQQVESYSPSTGSLLVWVQIPTIYASQNTYFYMYYGDAAYTGSDPTISAAFGSEYLGVYHMGTGTGRSLFELTDASTSANNATNTGTTNSAGKIGAASTFNGTTAYVTLPNESKFEISNFGKQTLSAWVNITTYSASAYAKYLDKGTGSWTLRRDNGSVRVEMREDYQSPEFLNAINTGGIAIAGWHYLVSTFDHEVNNMVVYIDGSSAASSKNVPANQIIQNNTNQVRIGADAGGVPGNYFKGMMDEVRIENVARTADWIKFEYDNMNNPVGFATISGETSCNLGAPSPGTATTLKTTLCIGQSTTLTLTGYSGGIYWQKSIDNSHWVYITGANNSTLNTGTLTKSTYYRASVSNCCEAFSNVILINYVAALPPALSLVPTDVKCFGQSSGSINLIITQGSGTYGYNWSNSATSQNLFNIPIATYQVVVTDLGTNCSENGQTTINQPITFSVSVSNSDETCTNSGNGSALATPSGGTSPYTYNWSNSCSTINNSNLISGTYNLTVTDANNCTASASSTISAINTLPPTTLIYHD